MRDHRDISFRSAWRSYTDLPIQECVARLQRSIDAKFMSDPRDPHPRGKGLYLRSACKSWATMERFELTATPWSWRLSWSPELILAGMPTRLSGSFDRGDGKTAIDFVARPAPDFYWIIGLNSVIPLSTAAIFSVHLPSLMWIWVTILLFEVFLVAALVASARRSVAYCKRVMNKVFAGE